MRNFEVGNIFDVFFKTDLTSKLYQYWISNKLSQNFWCFRKILKNYYSTLKNKNLGLSCEINLNIEKGCLNEN